MALIERHPLGFDGGVGAKGGAISVGQRQRVAIARAIARNPELLIFGESVYEDEYVDMRSSIVLVIVFCSCRSLLFLS